MILISGAVLLTLDARHVQFRLVGGQEITVPYGVDYIEPGRTATTVGRLFGPGFMVLPVETSGYVNTRAIGTYELKYSARFLFDTYTAKRTVHVEDITPPVITMLHEEGYEPSWFTGGYQDEGCLAWDDCDGDLTSQVQTEVLEDRIIYRVSDSSGNEAVAERELSAILPPQLSLLGDAYMTVDAGMSFEDPGFTALDGKGRDISALVSVEGEVIPYRPGVYELVYSITAGPEPIVATRTVEVRKVQIPDTVRPGEKTIYLTFDDGPGPYTGQLLDLLATYGVKVTFFVTSMDPEYEDMIGRAFREGHSIGVHSASHNYAVIYESEEAYMADFNKMEEVILRQTGEYTRLFRFPGGSSNTVSQFNPGIMTYLTAQMNDLGYQYFDWNVDSDDAGGTRTSTGVVTNVTTGCSGKYVSVVLMHDNKDYSVKAVEQIIIWGMQNGYTFRALEMDSPPAHHVIKN